MEVRDFVLIIIGIVAVLLIALALQGLLGGEWTTVAQGLTATVLMVGTFAFVLYGLKNAPWPLTILICGVAGIVQAAIEYSLHDQGILLDEFTTGTVTISDIMIVTVLIWLLVGAVYAVAKS